MDVSTLREKYARKFECIPIFVADKIHDEALRVVSERTGYHQFNVRRFMWLAYQIGHARRDAISQGVRDPELIAENKWHDILNDMHRQYAEFELAHDYQRAILTKINIESWTEKKTSIFWASKLIWRHFDEAKTQCLRWYQKKFQACPPDLLFKLAIGLASDDELRNANRGIFA